MSDTRPPMCGDDECENPSCQPAAYDAYVEQLGKNLRTLLGVPEGEQGVRLPPDSGSPVSRTDD